jgi:predicted phosphodiesterase
MRILIVGDSHCNEYYIKRIIKEANAHSCNCIIQLGDFGYWPYTTYGIKFLQTIKDNLNIPMYFINGNHDQLDALPLNADEPYQIQENLYYLPNSYKWEWEGVSFMSLGGAYSIDRNMGQLDHDWFLEEEITEEQVIKACNHKSVDILLTHDAPSCISINTIKGIINGKDILEAQPNRQKLTEVVYTLNPRYLFHGHWHNYYETDITLYEAPYNCKVVGLNHDCKYSNSFKVIDLEGIQN